MLVISHNSNPHATSAVFIEGWTICKPANHASNGKKIKFYDIVKLLAWKMFPAVPYILVCYTAVFSVVTQRSSTLTAAENQTTFLSLCVCGLTNKPIMYKKLDNTWAAGR